MPSFCVKDVVVYRMENISKFLSVLVLEFGRKTHEWNIVSAMQRMTRSTDVQELLQIFWGCLTQEHGTAQTLLIALAGIIALHETTGFPVSPYRAEAAVELLQCDYDETKKTCDCTPIFNGPLGAIVLLGMSHSSVVYALLVLLRHTMANGHGRRSTARVLTAFASFDQVVQAFLDVITDDAALSVAIREQLVMNLACLRVTESTAAIREACLRHDLPPGTYTTFLCCSGLSVDTDDEVVIKDINSPSLSLPLCATDVEKKEMTAAAVDHSTKMIE